MPPGGRFSKAFSEFPFDIGVVYTTPQQYGPANLLYREPTGYRATMVGFPYDDLERWTALYPPMCSCASGGRWRMAGALATLAQALAIASSPALAAEWRVAEAADLHFRSVANQVEFVLVRGRRTGRARELFGGRRGAGAAAVRPRGR